MNNLTILLMSIGHEGGLRQDYFDASGNSGDKATRHSGALGYSAGISAQQIAEQVRGYGHIVIHPVVTREQLPQQYEGTRVPTSYKNVDRIVQRLRQELPESKITLELCPKALAVHGAPFTSPDAEQ